MAPHRETSRVVLHSTSARIGMMAFIVAGALTGSPCLRGATPEEQLAGFALSDPQLQISLVAAEPDVLSPVSMAWDSEGRLYVAEMRDYPSAPTGGTIRRLEDKDGDGRYETSVVFADKISFPNGVLPWNGGVLVTAAPDILFLKDTDKDGVADQRRVLFTGFAKGNQQLRVNGLFWGIDGWIYGANGRSDGDITRPEGGEKWSLRGRDFRFRPETGEFETLAGRSQFGHGRDAWGNRFLSWNTIPLRHEVFPDALLMRNPVTASASVLVDCLPEGDSGQIYPLAPAPQVFNNESGSHFNALSGLCVYRGGALGPSYMGNAFVGESLRGVVHRRIVSVKGATFAADRGEQGREFLASKDPWCHPVNFAMGPDEALYVADFYRKFVEHPDWVARDTRDRVMWGEGREHGRIWRIARRSGDVRKPSPIQGLAALTDRQLLSELESPNAWRRETAQRLIYERGVPVALGSGLRSAAVNSSRAESRALVLNLLQYSPGEASAAVLRKAFQDTDPRVRAEAARLARNPRQNLFTNLIPLLKDPNPKVQMEAVLSLGDWGQDDQREPLLEQTARDASDPWVRLAAASGSRSTNAAWVLASLPKPPPTRPVPTPRGADPDRERVVAALQPALALTGDRTRGAAIFGRLCLSCHYLQGQGQRVGPDLSGIANRPVETLLTDILDPSRQVAPDYAVYELELVSGETITGMIASEAATRITVRHAGTPDESIARSQIRAMRSTGKSMMPEGLEQGLNVQDIADLIGFLKQPDAGLILK